MSEHHRGETEKEILKHIEDKLEEMACDLAANLPAIELDLNNISRSLAEIANFLIAPSKATKLVSTWTLTGGNSMANGAPVSGVVGNTASVVDVESNATNPSIAPIGPMQTASDNPSVTISADGLTATLAAEGTANVTRLDTGNGLSSTTAFTVSAAPPPVATDLTSTWTLNPTFKR